MLNRLWLRKDAEGVEFPREILLAVECMFEMGSWLRCLAVGRECVLWRGFLCIVNKRFDGVVGYHVRLTRERS